MRKPKIFYVFRRPVKKPLKEVLMGKFPEDFFYGYTQMGKFFDIFTTDKASKSKIVYLPQKIIDLVTSWYLDIGFSLVPAIFLLPEVKKADLVFATTDSYGAPLALMKKLGFYKTNLVINTTGLYDGLTRKNNPLAIKMYQTFLSSVDFFVSGQSFQECQKLARLLKIPISKFSFIPFGIDTDFFKPNNSKQSTTILAIGADPTRDWQLYAQVAELLPKEKFLIITYKGLVKTPMPNNVSFAYNLSPQALREKIWLAKISIILSKMNYHFAGQSTAFRCMSCAKPVILTQTPGVEEYKFKNNVHCLFVPPGDKKAVVSAILYLSASIDRRKMMGIKARKVIEKYYNNKDYSKGLKKIFNRIIQQNLKFKM